MTPAKNCELQCKVLLLQSTATLCSTLDHSHEVWRIAIGLVAYWKRMHARAWSAGITASFEQVVHAGEIAAMSFYRGLLQHVFQLLPFWLLLLLLLQGWQLEL